MEITLRSSNGDGERIIVQSLVNQYNPKISIKVSRLSKRSNQNNTI